MTVKLSIEITSPLSPDDHDLLSGIAAMTLAIANRELAAQGFPEAFPSEDGAAVEPTGEIPPVVTAACGAVSEDGAAACVSEVGHRGRHRFRKLPVATNNGLAN
jgi:hypothetical protein